MSSITHICIPGLAGAIYRCPMPFGPYDVQQSVFEEMKAHDVSVVVMLVSDEEAYEKSGRDLRELYANQGWQVIQLPTQDFGVPNPKDYQQVILQALHLAQTGERVAVHCSAGIGRTGLLLSGLVMAAMNLPADPAISYVRRFLPQAVETEQQRQFLHQIERFDTDNQVSHDDIDNL